MPYEYQSKKSNVPEDLVNQMLYHVNRFADLIVELNQAGIRKAEKEREYMIARRKKVIELREAGVPVSIIRELSLGDREVSNLRLQRDIAESQFQAALEVINLSKLTVRILDAQIAREWPADTYR